MNITVNVNSISDDEFSRFQRLLHDTAGIFLPPAKKVLVAGRLNKRLRHFGLKSYGDYYRMITSGDHPKEFQVMLDCLTTNETYFFSEPAHFEFLRGHLRSWQGEEPFRILSAACSSGEEVYTLAMVLAETLKSKQWEIIGSDINMEVLRQARQGLYPMERSSGIDRSLLSKYCLKGVRSQEGYFLIDEKLKRRVKFRQVNLKQPLSGVGRFDVIFLRNVMIYFDPKTKKDVVDRIAQALKPGGYFFISHSESLHGISDRLKMVRPSIFQRL